MNLIVGHSSWSHRIIRSYNSWDFSHTCLAWSYIRSFHRVQQQRIHHWGDKINNNFTSWHIIKMNQLDIVIIYLLWFLDKSNQIIHIIDMDYNSCWIIYIHHYYHHQHHLIHHQDNLHLNHYPSFKMLNLFLLVYHLVMIHSSLLLLSMHLPIMKNSQNHIPLIFLYSNPLSPLPLSLKNNVM